MGICLSASASSRTTSPPPSPSSLASSHPPSSSSCLVPRTSEEDDDKGAEAANFPPPVAAAASDPARKKRRGRRMEAPRRRGEEEEGRPQIIFARLLPPSFPLCHPPPAYARRKSLNFFPSPFQLPPLPATMWCTHSPFFSGTKALFLFKFSFPFPPPTLAFSRLSFFFPLSHFQTSFSFPSLQRERGRGRITLAATDDSTDPSSLSLRRMQQEMFFVISLLCEADSRLPESFLLSSPFFPGQWMEGKGTHTELPPL